MNLFFGAKVGKLFLLWSHDDDDDDVDDVDDDVDDEVAD